MPEFHHENSTHLYISGPVRAVYQPLDLSETSIYTLLFVILLVVVFVIFLLLMIFGYRRFLRVFNYFDPNSNPNSNRSKVDDYSKLQQELRRRDIRRIWERLTITDRIYDILMNKYSIPQQISDMIIKDYCGFNKIKMDPQKRIDAERRKVLWIPIILLILIKIVIILLLFKIYCAVLLIEQNEPRLHKKYTVHGIVFECECVAMNSNQTFCRIGNHNFNHSDNNESEYYRNYRDYNNFYEDIWMRYLEEYEPQLLDEYRDEVYVEECPSSGMNVTRYGTLHLSENGVDDCDYTNSQKKIGPAGEYWGHMVYNEILAYAALIMITVIVSCLVWKFVCDPSDIGKTFYTIVKDMNRKKIMNEDN